MASYGRMRHLENGCITCGRPFEGGDKIVVLKQGTVNSFHNRATNGPVVSGYTLDTRSPLVVVHADCWTGEDPR